MGRCNAELSLRLALARRLGYLGFRVRVSVGRLTWRLRKSLRAVCSSRESGPGRDKAKAQSGGAQEVAAPRSQGVRGSIPAPTLPAGLSSTSSPAMARRKQALLRSCPLGNQPQHRAVGGAVAVSPPHRAALHPPPGPAPRAERSAMGGASQRSARLGLHPPAPPLSETAYPWVGGIIWNRVLSSLPLGPASLTKSRLLERSGRGWGLAKISNLALGSSCWSFVEWIFAGLSRSFEFPDCGVWLLFHAEGSCIFCSSSQQNG